MKNNRWITLTDGARCTTIRLDGITGFRHAKYETAMYYEVFYGKRQITIDAEMYYRLLNEITTRDK